MIKTELSASIKNFIDLKQINKEKVTQFISDCRSLIEYNKEEEKYKLLYFYCNWLSHPNINRNKISRQILEEMSTGYFSTDANSNYNVVKYIKISELIQNTLDFIIDVYSDNIISLNDNFIEHLMFQLLSNLKQRKLHFPDSANNKSKKSINISKSHAIVKSIEVKELKGNNVMFEVKTFGKEITIIQIVVLNVKIKNNILNLTANTPRYIYCKNYNKGKRFFKEKKLSEAISCINESIKNNPNGSELFLLRADSHNLLKNHKSAISDYSKAIQLNPYFDVLYLKRGCSKAESLDYKGAIEDFDKVIQLNFGNVDAYNFRGQSNLYLKNYKDAIDDFNRVIALNPSYEDIYLKNATAKYFIGDFRGAIEDLNIAIQFNANDGELYFNRGLANKNLGEVKDACLDLKKAHSLGVKEAMDEIKGYCN